MTVILCEVELIRILNTVVVNKGNFQHALVKKWCLVDSAYINKSSISFWLMDKGDSSKETFVIKFLVNMTI